MWWKGFNEAAFCPSRWSVELQGKACEMLHTQATCDYHVVQQSVRHCQQHRWAPRDPATYRHHHPPGKDCNDCSHQPNIFTAVHMMFHKILFFSQVSSMGITPFFVENVSELQLCAIKLVTAVSLFFFSHFICCCFLHFDLCVLSLDVYLMFCKTEDRDWPPLLFLVSRFSRVMRSIGSWSWRRSLLL